MKKEGVLIVISGPSGSGKGTLCKSLLNENKDIKLSISATTRKPREGEQEGIHYFFKEKSEFEEMIEKNELLEWATYCDNYYGSPKKYIEDQLNDGKDIILEIEVQGALKVKEHFNKGVFIFVVPPTLDELNQRLLNRGTEEEAVIQKRLKRAVEEISLAKHYDYIVINDVIDEAVDEILSIIKAEKCKYPYNELFLNNFKGEN